MKSFISILFNTILLYFSAISHNLTFSFTSVSSNFSTLFDFRFLLNVYIQMIVWSFSVISKEIISECDAKKCFDTVETAF